MVDYSTLKNYNIMNKQKLNYLAPEAETLVIRFEGSLCVSGPFGSKNGAGKTPEEDDDYTYGM